MMKKLVPVSAALAAALMLSACATSSTTNADGQPLTPEEKRLRESAAVYNQTLLEGGLLGCAGGALLGYFLGGKDNRLAGAAVGCAGGAVVGVSAASYVADKQQNYATNEERYNAMIADVRTDNQRLGTIIADSSAVIASDRARIDQIDLDLQRGKLSMEQARNQMKNVDANTEYMQNTLDALKKKHETYAEAAQKVAKTATPAQRNAMEAEIATLEKQIAQLDSEIKTLVQRRSVSRVG